MSLSQWKSLLGKLSRKRSSVQRGVAYHRGRLKLELLEVRINPQVTITGPTALTAGTRVMLNASLMAPSDPSEDGEGESLDITSNGNVIASDTDYNDSTSYSYLATQPTETIGASLNGEDGDETGSVAITVITTTPRFTPQEKADFTALKFQYQKMAARYGTLATVYGAAGVVSGVLAGVSAIPTFGTGAAIFSGATVGFAGGTAAAAILQGQAAEAAINYEQLAGDPSDPNFTTVAQPANLPIYISLQNPDPSVQPQLNAVNALLANNNTEISLAQALNTAINRSEGAQMAGDSMSFALQESAINQFSSQLAGTLNAKPALQLAAQSALMGLFGSASTTVTPTQVMNYESSVQANGLSASDTMTLALSGASAADIAAINQFLFVQDSTASSGDAVALLSDSTSLATVQSVANDLVAASVSLSQSSVTVTPATIPEVTGKSTITLQVADSTGTPETTGGLSVSFGLAPGSASGTFGPVTDNGNGTYTDVFTAGSTSGSASITATVAGSALTSPTPVVTIGQRIDELGAYRASDGSWSLDSDTSMGFNSATDQVFFSFSPPGVTGVAGDWTGSGNSEVGDFNPTTAVWHLDLAGTGAAPGANETFQFGQAGDKPVVGDWTGNGVTNIGVFRANSDGTGEFILDTNGDHVLDAGDTSFSFGLANDRIVIGDWNGAGKDEVGVFREAVASGFPAQDAGDAVFSLDTNGDQTFDSGDQVLLFGRFTDGLIVGDWNGAGKTELGVYREAVSSGFPQQDAGDAIFSLDTNGNGTFDASDAIFLYGLNSDQFVSGHWAITPPLQPEGTPQTPQAQFAANGPGPDHASPLTEAQLQPVLQQAIAAWGADGANMTQLEAAQVTISTLDNNLLGETSGNQITLDATADGWGWNTDTSNTAFTSTGPDGLQATPGSAAAGEMDLLTVVEHEYGHVLGLSDVNPLTQPGSLMAATLPVGVRRNPTVVADAVFASGSLSPM